MATSAMLSSPASRQGHLHAQIKLVHNATGKPLNEIRTDLEYTGDAQETIRRISNGELLKGTQRDPSSKAQPINLMSPKSSPLNTTRGGAKRQLKRKRGAMSKKTAPQPLEVIDLCDSDDDSPPAVRFKRPSTFRSSDVWGGAARARPNLAGPSNPPPSNTTDSLLSVTKPYANRAAVPKKTTEAPPPRSSSPLFLPSIWSSSSSPEPPPSPPRLSTGEWLGTKATPPKSHSQVASLAPTPQPKKRKITNVIELDDDSDSGPQSVASPISKRPCTNLGAAARGLLQQVAESSSDSDSDGGGVPEVKGRTTKARRAAEKEAAKFQRQRERDAKAAEKEEAKMQKKREKEVFSFNKLRTSTKDSAPEMIVDISQHFQETAIGEELQHFLAGFGCEVNPRWYPAVGEGTWRVVKWRRKVKAEYDEGQSMFIPLPEMKVTDEYHVLVYITAKEFLDIAMDCDGSGLPLHVSRLRQLSPRRAEEVKLIYIIEGLDALIRKNKSNRNKAFQNRVRAVLGASKGRAGDAELIDEDAIQDALLKLQVVHGCQIHHTVKEMETVEWISRFTGDISLIPYKKSRETADMAFCTDVGQVKSGVGKADTYGRMLEEINRVTPPVANSVASKYPDVAALVRGFKRYGENALADFPITTARDRVPINRKIGAACSKRMYEIFMGTDPDSPEV